MHPNNSALDPHLYPDSWIDAWRFAANVHQGQKVPGSDLPYVYHLGAVVMELLAAHAESPINDINLAVVCGALHDTVEDHGIPTETLRQRFGAAVAAGVEALSKNRTLPKDKAMADSLERIRGQPAAVWCVKLADRIVNLAPPPSHWAAEKIAAYREEAGVILSTLGAAHAPLAARLSKKIALYPSGN